jgi:ketosteroid isomerase-like protein
MKFSRFLICALITFKCGIAPGAGMVGSDTGDEANIRNTREAFNQAIRDQDVDAIERFFAPGYHIISGRSQQYHGAETQRELWASLFGNGPGFVCQRDIRELRINPDWGLAEELGNWNCHYTMESKASHASGVYAAKWQRTVGGQWLIQSEVFTTMTCSGSDAACKAPDPIERN